MEEREELGAPSLEHVSNGWMGLSKPAGSDFSGEVRAGSPHGPLVEIRGVTVDETEEAHKAEREVLSQDTRVVVLGS